MKMKADFCTVPFCKGVMPCVFTFFFNCACTDEIVL